MTNRPEQRETPTTQAAGDYREMEAILGPYRGHRLTMTNADADAGRDAHWLINPFDPDSYDHPELTSEERDAAIVAAEAWAKAQWDAAQGIVPPPAPPEGEIGATRRGHQETETPQQRRERERQREMKPDHHSGDYKTR